MHATYSPIALSLTVSLVVTVSAQTTPTLGIDRVDPEGALVMRLENQPAGTTWQLEGSSDLNAWEAVAPGGVPVRFSHGEGWTQFVEGRATRYFLSSQTESDLSAELYDVGVLRDVHL